MANIYAMADTWDDAGTTFTGIGLNVTDTASASGSLLMDLQVGGSSKFSVDKLGNIHFRGHDIRSDANAMVLTNSSGVRSLVTRSDYSLLPSSSYLGWGNLTSFANDLRLYRDAANTLAQRNSTNAQTFNLYNTYTDASNYERGFMKWNSNVLEIGTEAAGTGSVRTVRFPNGSITLANLTVASTGITFQDWNASFGFNGGTSYRQNNATEAPLITFGGSELLLLGGTTSSFPAIKRSTTSLQARLADDTDFTNIQGKLTTETAYTAGAPTATGYIVLYDSTGTAYKVPAEAL